MELRVRPAREQDGERLLEVWERSVRASHSFLEENDIVMLRPLVAEALASDAIEWWAVANADDAPVGFLGFAGSAIEGLFIDPACHR